MMTQKKRRKRRLKAMRVEMSSLRMVAEVTRNNKSPMILILNRSKAMLTMLMLITFSMMKITLPSYHTQTIVALRKTLVQRT